MPVDRLAAGGNFPPEPLLDDIDPEKLARITAEQVPALLEANYKPLKARGAELVEAGSRWLDAHWVKDQYVIADEADLNRTSELAKQISGYAGHSAGEVREAHTRVKGPIHRVGTAIDGWFRSLIEGPRTILDHIDAATAAYQARKLAEAQAERRRQEEAAREQARQAAAEAKRLADEAAAATATAATAAAAEAALEVALAAEQIAETVSAPRSDQALVRSHSAHGVTTTSVDNWVWALEDGGIMALARAVVAGEAPADFLTTNDTVINAAVRPKNGRRKCPGLIIRNVPKPRRS